jgi:hypothetical protein
MRRFLLITAAILCAASATVAGPKKLYTVVPTDFYTKLDYGGTPPQMPKQNLLRALGHSLFPFAIAKREYVPFGLIPQQAVGTNVTGVGGSNSSAGFVTSSAFTFFLATSSSCATPSLTGTFSCAVDNSAGTFTANADFGPIIRAAFIAKSSSCGELDFRDGIYPINTLVAETTGGFTQSNAILIPAQVAANQYCQWKIHGETDTPAIDQFTTPAGITGVIFNITPAAISSVAGGTVIFGIWARPDVANGVGASVWGDNFDVRFPTNQRGNETAIDLTQALNVHLVNVTVDTAVAQINLLFPVAGSSGLFGITSTASTKEENYFEHSFAIGYDHCFDIQGEHTVVTNSFALNCNHGWDLGVRGPALVTAPQVYVQSGCAQTARCLTLGANLQTGTLVTMDSWTFEDQAVGGIFVPVYHALETNTGGSYGLMSYDNSLEGGNATNGSYANLPNPFDGGGGSRFTFIGLGSSKMNQLPGSDTFSRPNTNNLGAPWIGAPLGTHLSIVSNAAGYAAAGAAQSNEAYAGLNYNNDQFAQVTLSTLDSNAATNGAICINELTTAVTNYCYYVSNAAATGSGIVKDIAGAQTVLANQTAVSGASAGDIIRLLRQTLPSGNVVLWAFKNGKLDTNFTPNPVIESVSKLTGGYPSIQLTQDATNGIAATNFIGGNQPTVTGLDSLYGNPVFTPQLFSDGAAPTLTGTGACTTFTNQVPLTLGNRSGSFRCTTATAASTITITFALPAPNGYRCSADDETTIADTPHQSSFTTTTCVLTTAATVQNDFITWNAEPF